MAEEKKADGVETAENTKKSSKAAAQSGKIEEVIETIKNLSVMDLAQLVKTLEKEFGVTAAAPMMAAVPAAAAGAPAAAAAEEKTDFTVMLQSFGTNKIQIIKVVRAITGLGLKEAKDLVEAVPSPVKESVPKDEAQNIKKQLEEAGATVVLK